MMIRCINLQKNTPTQNLEIKKANVISNDHILLPCITVNIVKRCQELKPKLSEGQNSNNQIKKNLMQPDNENVQIFELHRKRQSVNRTIYNNKKIEARQKRNKHSS